MMKLSTVWLAIVAAAVVALIILLAISAAGPSSSSVVANGLSKDIDSQTGEPVGLTNAFSSADNRVYSWIELGGAPGQSHNVTWLFVTPQGTHYSRSVRQVSPGNLSSSIKVVGSVAGNMLGGWSVMVYVDGQRALTQSFTIGDTTVPTQPVRQFPWPFHRVYVHVLAQPYFAKEAVVSAMKQWNLSQAWFQQQYGLSPLPTYDLILSNGSNSAMSVSFNATASPLGYTSNAESSFSFGTGNNVSAKCSVSIALALRNGTKFNGIFIENAALNQLGYCLGLGRVAFSGDLMNAFSENVYDLNSPSTLNLYSLYQLSTANTSATLGIVRLPASIPYMVSPQPNPGPTFPVSEFLIATAILALAISIDLFRRRRSKMARGPSPSLNQRRPRGQTLLSSSTLASLTISPRGKNKIHRNCLAVKPAYW